MDGVPIRVQAIADFGCDLDLVRLCRQVFLNCELRSHAKELRIEMRPRALVKLSSTGMATIDGLLSIQEARHALKRVARRCKKLLHPEVTFRGFTVDCVRWAEHYQPDFPIDIVALSRTPGIEVRGDEDRPGTGRGRRIIVPCSKADHSDDPSKASSSRVGGRKKFFVEGSYQDVEPTDIPLATSGVYAEVHSDGRTMFWQARDIQELQYALEIMEKLFEDVRLKEDCEAAKDVAKLYKKRKSSSNLLPPPLRQRLTKDLSADAKALDAPSFELDDASPSEDDDIRTTSSTPIKDR
eukprot:CAMPEP_0206428232 /NCGR_PEP_ID=MMETSP0324_2-20121206/5528_1 /ASSEMBLY_ACC=CAM_ASM_000836 /TAXON_ID=2866 /ORGANISM="Crypthecodinium cohnii, Strain Seligo" /LENGTH=295 /DNA_ID=CAMNT_0053893693 /DNA_START=55 /DNA_END=938 /DNA_ORIENTATION=-